MFKFLAIVQNLLLALGIQFLFSSNICVLLMRFNGNLNVSFHTEE